MDISQTLSTMSSTLQVLTTTSLETEKIQHLKLLKDLNQHLIDLISQKTQNMKTSLGLTQTIIKKQESVHKTICDKLIFKYFLLNMVCSLLIAFTVVFGLNIAALIKHTQISEQN